MSLLFALVCLVLAYRAATVILGVLIASPRLGLLVLSAVGAVVIFTLRSDAHWGWTCIWAYFAAMGSTLLMGLTSGLAEDRPAAPPAAAPAVQTPLPVTVRRDVSAPDLLRSAEHLLLIARGNRDTDLLADEAASLRARFGSDLDAEWFKLRVFATEVAIIESQMPPMQSLQLERAIQQLLADATGASPDAWLTPFRSLPLNDPDHYRPIEHRVADLFSFRLEGACIDDVWDFGRRAFEAACQSARAYLDQAFPAVRRNPAAAAAAG